jgi:branched-chain amino acid transport system ATP-binding protein
MTSATVAQTDHRDTELGPPALELIHVRAGYGKLEVLHDVSLVVPPATIVALLGPNGASKSTVLGVASGRVVPTSGCVHLAGRHINGAAPQSVAKAGVCSIPEGRGVFPNLTVRDNLKVWTHSAGRSLSVVEDVVYEKFPRLSERRGQLAGRLSGGEQQMLAVSRALVAEAGLLLLDELSMGLAPRVVGELYDLVTALTEEGMAILMVEQFARTAMRIADYVAVMAGGEVRLIGEPADVEEGLAAAYLGGHQP